MERDEGKFFYCSSFIACEQAPLFGQAKRASRKCANEGPFPCLLARLASLGQRSKRFQSSYCAKVRAEAKKKKRFQSSYCAKVRADPLPRHSFFFLLLSQFSRRTSRGNACYAGYASLAQIGELARRLSLPWGLHEFPRASTYPRSSLTHPQKGTSLYIKRLQTYGEKEPSRAVKNFDSDKEPTVFFSVDFQSFNRYFV